MPWTGCTWKPAEQFTGAIFLSASQIQKEYLKMHACETHSAYMCTTRKLLLLFFILFFFLRRGIFNEIRNCLHLLKLNFS